MTTTAPTHDPEIEAAGREARAVLDNGGTLSATQLADLETWQHVIDLETEYVADVVPVETKVVLDDLTARLEAGEVVDPHEYAAAKRAHTDALEVAELTRKGRRARKKAEAELRKAQQEAVAAIVANPPTPPNVDEAVEQIKTILRDKLTEISVYSGQLRKIEDQLIGLGLMGDPGAVPEPTHTAYAVLTRDKPNVRTHKIVVNGQQYGATGPVQRLSRLVDSLTLRKTGHIHPQLIAASE